MRRAAALLAALALPGPAAAQGTGAALRRTPNAAKEAPAPLVIGALRAAFPCRP